MGVVFDVDHDFEGPRAPKAHLDTVKYKPVTSPGTPLYSSSGAIGNQAEGEEVRRANGARGVSVCAAEEALRS